MQYSFESKGTTIQCKNKVERTKKRTNDHKNKSLISSTFQRNHGGEALLQQRNKQQTNNKQTQQTIIIPCQDLKDPRANKMKCGHPKQKKNGFALSLCKHCR